jgi:hypothetical protein
MYENRPLTVGLRASSAHLCDDKVLSFGFLMAQRKNGPFKLQIKEICALSTEALQSGKRYLGE